MSLRNVTRFTPQASTIKTLALASAISLLSACATAPEPEPQPMVQKPVAAPQQPVLQDRAPIVQEPLQQAQPLPPATNFVMPGSVDDFVQSAGDRIFFGYDRFDLSNEARNVLRAQAQWLSSYPDVIAVIGGHADERGTREYNLALGARRADAVRDFLISQGVDPRRLTTVSYGKERPIDGRSNEEAWALNRNGHTAIVSGANS